MADPATMKAYVIKAILRHSQRLLVPNERKDLTVRLLNWNCTFEDLNRSGSHWGLTTENLLLGTEYCSVLLTQQQSSESWIHSPGFIVFRSWYFLKTSSTMKSLKEVNNINFWWSNRQWEINSRSKLGLFSNLAALNKNCLLEEDTYTEYFAHMFPSICKLRSTSSCQLYLFEPSNHWAHFFSLNMVSSLHFYG